ncbi:hypothetical protein CWE08_09835 [Aliidiomarina iranensis]|uniref:Agmatine deiminase n=1 Tax=Aliidiomarina iranensis TaxID=1434071 RepID=A0A432VSE1_9GAMM|nr:agmatine deiminase family protein [Aliidiomarina iranensis]RUO19277.1 hypothetical protein CWE08_09835 [Aliidiomarina iranensis]
MSSVSIEQATAIALRTEWSESESLWLRWPYREEVWPQTADEWAAVQNEYLLLLQALAAANIPVNLQVAPGHLDTVNKWLAAQSFTPALAVHLHEVSYGDVWLRDCAPFLAVNSGGSSANSSSTPSSKPAAWHFQFDGWGGIDDQYPSDIQARDWLTAQLGVPADGVQTDSMVLEGGALHHDGEGTAIACAGSILFRPGNDGLTAAEFRQKLHDVFAIDKVLMVPGRLAADETGGHIDNLATFLAPGVVVIAYTDDASHPDYATCRRVLDFFEDAVDAQGRAFVIHKLPLPRAPRLSAAEAVTIKQRPGVRRRIAGMPLMASYVNFLRINCRLAADSEESGSPVQSKLIVMPGFGLPSDEIARNLMAKWLPDYRVVSVPARALLVGGGGWHCASFAY